MRGLFLFCTLLMVHAWIGILAHQGYLRLSFNKLKNHNNT